MLYMVYIPADRSITQRKWFILFMLQSQSPHRRDDVLLSDKVCPPDSSEAFGYLVQFYVQVKEYYE